MAEDVVSSEAPAVGADESDALRGTAGAVVAGLDGSAADDAVVDRAADEAAWLDAPLRLVSAVDPGLQLTPYEALATGSPSLADHLEEGAHHILERAVARVDERHPGLDVATAVPWGPPAAAVVRLSEGARRVVVGAPAHGRFQRFVMGSVALPVIAHAHCSVLVVPANTEVRPPRCVVVGVDGSEGCASAIDLALVTAEAAGCHVIAVLGWNIEVQEGVVVTEPGSPRWLDVEARHAARVHAVLDPLAAAHPGVPREVLVRHGASARALLEVASEQDADLLVVGSRGHGGFRGLLLGSVTRRVVQHADRVVAIAR